MKVPGGRARRELVGDWCLTAARWALYGAVLAPLAYSTAFVFPFVVPAGLWFRLAVAAAGVLAAAGMLTGTLAVRRPRDRVLGAMVLFLVVAAISAAAGEAPLHSFFGGYERMGGVLAWAHYVAYYLLLRGLMGRDDWTRWLRILVGTASVAAAVGALQAWGGAAGWHRLLEIPRAKATLGNPGYLSVLLLLGLGGAGLLVRRTGTRWERWLVAAAGGLQVGVLLLSAIRTTLVALVAALLAGAVLLALAGTSSSLRRWARRLAGVVLVLAAGLWLARDSAPVRSIPTLADAAGTRLEGESVQTRLVAWEAAVEGVRQAPVLGAGPENYRLVFDRHFSPRLYEAWPGRLPYLTEAHNDYLEAAAETGLAGALAFLVFWMAVGRRAWAGVRGGLDPPEAALAGACFTAYAVVLLTWFRTPNTFPAFVGLVAFTGASVGGWRRWLRPGSAPARGEDIPEGRNDDLPSLWIRGGAAVLLGLFIAGAVHTVLLAGPARGLARAFGASEIAEKVERYEATASSWLPGAEEAATEYATLMAGLDSDALGGQRGEARTALERGFRGASRALEATIGRDPANARHRALAADLAFSRFRFDGDSAHLERGIEAARRAVERSPPRLRYRRMLSDLLMTVGRPREALSALEEARSLLGGLGELHYAIAKIHAAEDRLEPAVRSLQRADGLGYEPERSNRPVYARVARSLLAAGDTARAQRVLGMAGGSFSFE